MGGQDWPLIGRGDTLASIVRAARRAERAGVIVVGPPGVGRTRLARAALAAVTAAGEHGGTPGGGARSGWAPGWAMASRSTVHIPLGALSHLLPDFDPGDGFPGRLLYEARRTLLRVKGEDTLLLAVDDAHLLDETSAVLLHQLASCGDAFLLLTAPTGVTVPDPVFGLWKEGLVDRIDLAELSREQSDRLVVEAVGGHVDGGALQRLWALSLGNPLFLRELVHGGRASGALHRAGTVWRWDGPFPITQRLAELVQVRADAPGPQEQDLLRLLAFGQPLGSDLAADMTSLPTVTTAEDRGLVTSRRTGRRVEVTLTHPLHAEILRRQATPLQEREAYQRLADALEARGVRREEDRWRLLEWRTAMGMAGDPDDLLAAAADVEESNPRLAERLLREAASGGGAAARMRHARVLIHLGRSDEGEKHLAELSAEPGLSDDMRLTIATARVHNQYWGLHDGASARALITEVCGDLGAHGPPGRVALRAFGLLLDGRDAEAAAAVAVALDGPDRPDDGRLDGRAGRVPGLAELAVAAFAEARCGRPARAREHARRGTASTDTDPTGGWLRFELLYAMWFADLQTGELDSAEELARGCHAQAFAAGQGDRVALFGTWVGIVEQRRGRLRTAARWLLEAAAGVSAARFAFAVPLVSELAMALAGLGQSARARVVLDEASGQEAVSLLIGWIEPVNVWLAGIGGRMSEAERIALTAAEEARGHSHRATALHTAVRLGVTGAVTDRLSELAAEAPGTVPDLYAAHGAALAARDATALDDIADRFAAVGLVLLAAEAAAQASAEHRAAGHAGSAGGSASRAKAWAQQCEGAATPALDLLEGSTDLTRREMEIASLAASGMTSKAIAGQLVVSVRTVDNVLRMVYAKLGVSGRGDLAQVAGIRVTR